MKTSTRAAGLAATVVAAVVLGAASFAWACSPQARVGGLNPTSGPAGTKATLTASEFYPGPVQIHWNSTTGKELATAQGPSFSVTFAIPDDSPGVYTVVAVQRGAGGSILGKASTTFELTPSSTTHRGGYTFGPGTGDSTEPEGSATEGSTNGASQPGGDTSSRSGGTAAKGVQSYGNGGAAFGPEPGAAESPSAAPAGVGARQPATASAAGGSPSGAASAQGGGAQAPVAAAAADESDQAVSARAGLADIWSGFEAERSKTGASLTEAAPLAGGTTPVAAGAALLSLGLLALFAGFGVAELSRRRAVAGARR